MPHADEVEIQLLHKFWDGALVPRADVSGAVYSLTGRMRQYTLMANKSLSAPHICTTIEACNEQGCRDPHGRCEEAAMDRDAVLEEAARLCEAQNDNESWPTPLGCAHSIRALKQSPRPISVQLVRQLATLSDDEISDIYRKTFESAPGCARTAPKPSKLVIDFARTILAAVEAK